MTWWLDAEEAYTQAQEDKYDELPWERDPAYVRPTAEEREAGRVAWLADHGLTSDGNPLDIEEIA